MATIGSKWSLVPKNGWNKVEQGWNWIGGIRNDHSDHFATPLMAIFGPQGVQNGSKWVYIATIGSKWSLVTTNVWTEVEQGWNGIGGIRTDHSDHFTTP